MLFRAKTVKLLNKVSSIVVISSMLWGMIPFGLFNDFGVNAQAGEEEQGATVPEGEPLVGTGSVTNPDSTPEGVPTEIPEESLVVPEVPFVEETVPVIPEVVPAEPVVAGPECVTDSTYVDSTVTDWETNYVEDWARTVGPVQLGVTYTFPQDPSVSIRFTCLPAKSEITPLKIERIQVSELYLPSGIYPATEYAYDFTTGMTDGTFTYDVTLPKDPAQDAEDLGVSYIEKNIDTIRSIVPVIAFEDIQSVANHSIVYGVGTIEILGVDHFTTYIVHTYASDVTTLKNSYNRGETVYARGTSTETKTLRLVFKDNIGSPVLTCPEVSGQETTCNYPLALSANVGQWSVELQRKKGNGSWQKEGTANFQVTSLISNPPLSQSCGLDMVLVLDSSDSMSNGDITTVKNAAKTLVTSLISTTPTKIGVIDFDTTVISSLNPTANGVDIVSAIDSIGHTNLTEYTNWEAALKKADTMVGAGGLVVIITDGNPTRSDGHLSDLDDAIAAANTLKSGGTRILAIGIRSHGTGGGLSEANLVAISGAIVSPPASVTAETDVITGDISGLVGILANFVNALCGGTISVNKYIDTVSDATRGGADWSFNVSGPNTYSNDLGTDGNGQAVTDTLVAGSGYSVIEYMNLIPSGFSFGSASCHKPNPTGGNPIIVGEGFTDGSGNQGVQNINVGDSDVITCDFVNTTVLQTGSISGVKWEDMNGDGNKDAEDLPIFGWTVNLDKDADGSIDGTTTTNASGNYTFSNLLPGNYKIIERTSSPWNTSFPAVGVNYYDGIVLASGQNLTGYDFGNYKNGTISGYKWVDSDADGNKEAGEGVPSSQWQIKLWKDNGTGSLTELGTAYTLLLDGKYEFGYGPGTYYVSEVMQTGWAQTWPNNAYQLSPDGVTRMYGPIVVTSGSVSENNNFGNVQLGKIIVDKIAVPDSSVETFNFNYWYAGNGPYSFTVDSNSSYTIDNLLPGNYSLNEASKDGWISDNLDENIKCSNGSIRTDVNVSAGETVTCAYTNTKMGKISGYKFEDINGNGTQDEGENGLEGWNIFRDGNGDGIYDGTQTDKPLYFTDATGYYETNYLPNGTYSICEELHSGWTPTTQVGNCQTVTITDGSFETVNFGNQRNSVTIVATKIVCDNESDLPNWGTELNGAPAEITSTTAQDYVDGSEGKCHLESGWNFQWGNDSASNPGDAYYGEAPGWTTFGTTDGSGIATVAIADFGTASQIKVREVLKNGYIPFTYTTNGNSNTVSAELYCHTDVLNYDNDDRFTPEYGHTYYCVAFNAPQTSTVEVCKYNVAGEPLDGWNVHLLGAKVEGPITVNPDGVNVTSDSLATDDYVLVANGQYKYRNGNPSGDGLYYSDANYSERAEADALPHGEFWPWVNVNTFTLPVNGWLGIMVHGSATDWSSYYNPEHLYSLGYQNWSGAFNFQILDDHYEDNTGNLAVDIYKGYAGTTEVDGCVTFTDVPYGQYTVGEVLRDGWIKQRGEGLVTVDQTTEKFDLVNARKTGTLEVTKVVDWKTTAPDTAKTFELCVEGPSVLPATCQNVDFDGGTVIWGALLPGVYTITESDPGLAWAVTGSGVEVTVPYGDSTTHTITNTRRAVTIVATKIVCDTEADLPNWGLGGPDITATTASDFLSTHSSCHLESGWGFQWGNDSASNPGDAYYGEAPGWTTFGTTDGSGIATVAIADFGTASQIKVREVLKNGYIPFSYTTNGNSNTVSAELYCHTDVLNYDNDDRFTPEYGNTYYCVAFNAIQSGSIQGTKYEDMNGNGVWNTTGGKEPGIGGWKIVLKQGGKVIKKTVTDENGAYSFSDLLPGNYKVCEKKVDGWKNTQPGTSLCYTLTLNAGDTEMRNFGNFQLGMIQGRKYDDLMGDGIYQSSGADMRDTFMNDWTVRLYQEGDKGWTQVGEDHTTGKTGKPGQYRFEDLDQGTYFVCEGMQDGWTQTGPLLRQITQGTDSINPTELGEADLTGMIELYNSNRMPVPNISPNVSSEGGVCWMMTIRQSGQFRKGLNFGNFKLGSIEGWKWDDRNGNGFWEETEKALEGWEITLCKLSPKYDPLDFMTTEETMCSDVWTATTNSEGKYEFSGLHAGAYRVYETMQSGWVQTSPSDPEYSDWLVLSGGMFGGQECMYWPREQGDSMLPVGDRLTRTCPNFGNYTESRLQIVKSNDAVGNLNPGDAVTYTIKVTALDNDVFGVTVFDTLPQGFAYRSGSGSVSCNTLGFESKDNNGKTLNTLPSGPIGSYTGGIDRWNLGDMPKNMVCTITYIADISENQMGGTYPDLAMASGTDGLAQSVNAVDGDNLGDPTDTFAGTKVSVVTPLVNPAVGVVLGTQTENLQQTGQNILAYLIGALGGLVGLALLYLLSKSKNKNLIVVLALGLFVCTGFAGFRTAVPAYAVEDNLAVEIQTPQPSMNTKTFPIEFSVLDRLGRGIEWTCYYHFGDADPTIEFATGVLSGYGGSASCEVDSSVITLDGMYSFGVEVSADSGADTSMSNTVKINYDSTKPGTLVSYTKTKVSACEYMLTFKTANDSGDTTLVEIYRSDKTSFTADASTLLASVVVGSNTETSYTHIIGGTCPEKSYYALRAVDKSGNTSDFTIDTYVVVTPAVPVGGAGTVGGAGAVGGAGGTVAGAETEADGSQGTEGNGTTDENGEVLGTDEDETSKDAEKDSDNDGIPDTEEADTDQDDAGTNWGNIIKVGAVVLGVGALISAVAAFRGRKSSL